MKGAYIDSAIRAELKRARREGGQIDRGYLKRETGLKSHQLEPLISKNALELIAEESVNAKLAARRDHD